MSNLLFAPPRTAAGRSPLVQIEVQKFVTRPVRLCPHFSLFFPNLKLHPRGLFASPPASSLRLLIHNWPIVQIPIATFTSPPRPLLPAPLFDRLLFSRGRPSDDSPASPLPPPSVDVRHEKSAIKSQMPVSWAVIAPEGIGLVVLLRTCVSHWQTSCVCQLTRADEAK
ncbi:unnamed protein product [Protopolystoma xenopodis]|uniref:Uncharacterized protein n=1 Tax=Protopolystoma xenopodis TaxID=117903 RepID=A0A448X353_9PLAT|nr:unnamed protein product [Protopolystoma xenopodis]